MNTERKIVQFRQRDKRFELPLLLSDFRAQAQDLLFAISEAQEEFSYAYNLFGRGADIWKDQCERANYSIQLIGRPIHQFYQLMLNTAQLPEDIAPFRYPLVILLHRMDEQVQSLIRLLTEFRTICRKPSKQRIRLRQVIEKLLAELVQNCDEVQLRTNVLFNRMNQTAVGAYTLRVPGTHSEPTVLIGYGPLAKKKQWAE